MNNHGNTSLSNNLSRRLNLSNTASKVPVSATANSRIQLSTGEFDIQETVISTEVTASNPSVAAARATAKAASIATSNLTSGTKYLSQNDLQNNFTFQISTFCTIQQITPELSDADRYSDPYLHINHMNRIQEPRLYKNTPGFQKGTKFERLRRELESLGQDNQNDLSHDYHVDSLNKSSRQSNISTLSNRSTSSSLKSEPATYHSILSEPLTYSSDGNNPAPYESVRNRYNTQKNAFLSSEFDSSDSNSNSKKLKISDLKRSDKISNFDGKLKEIKATSDHNRDVNSLYCLQTKPGNAVEKSFTLNRDIGALFSNSSSLLETDIDSGTLSNGNLFPQTNFFAETTPYSFEKTRSMIDIRKGSDVSYSEGITRALSSEDLKKPKVLEDNNLVKRLKSKAQSTQELRIADSLTKLNVPEWMKDFRSTETRSTIATPTEGRRKIYVGESQTPTFKDIKRHDSILSRYKYDSLPMTRVKEKPTQPIQVTLPSTLYRSKSQNLVYFKPSESSKLKEAMENVTSSLRSLNITSRNEEKKQEPILDFKSPLSPIHVVEPKTFEKKFESPTQRFESRLTSAKGLDLDKKVEISIKSSESKVETKSEMSLKLSESRIIENKVEKPVKPIEHKELENKILSPSHQIRSNSSYQKTEETSVKRIVLSQQDQNDEVNFKNFEVKDNIVMQSKKESQFFLQKIIESTLNPKASTDEICEAFKINPTTLKLLLNVKRKTPNLNRDETFANMKLNESSYIENALRRNESNKYVICCDFKSCKNELFHTSKVSRTTCSCYNCYTYYCSKKCRNMGFTQHFHSCSFKRIREMLLKIKANINEQQINALSKYAHETYKSAGRGVIVIAFESCRSADDFLNKQPNRLMSQPSYLRLSDMTDLEVKDFMDYIPEKEFVVCFIIIATLPMTSVELSYPTFKCPQKIKYPFTPSVNKDISSSTRMTKEIPTENSHPKVKFEEEVKVANDKTSYETRREFFNYVVKFFETKNVSLIQNYSSIYKKLENYLQEGINFEPLTIYIKDPLINSTVSCTIFPNKDITLKPVRTATKTNKSVDFELKHNGHKTLAETEI